MRRRLTALLLLAALLLAGCGAKSAGKTEVRISDTGTDSQLAGDWYGWWNMTDADGDWKKLNGYWWDCCAQLKDEGGGSWSMLIWDEDLPKDNCLATLTVLKTEDGLRCVKGKLLDEELELDSCTIRLKNGELKLSGKYTGKTSGSFSYTMRLRQWGERWDDAEKDELPYYYKDWYLPLIEDGKPIPDKIGK